MRNHVARVLVLLSCGSAPFLAACADTLPDQDLRITEAHPVERLSAALLWQDFQTQRETAERNYNGRAVIVVGDVTRTGSGAPGERYVYFGQNDTGGVHASLLDEVADDILAAVRDNPRVSLKCFCEGMSTSDVILKSCIGAP